MTLATAATLTLGTLRYTVQIRSVSVELMTLPGINRADIVVAAGVQVDARPGTAAELRLDGGDGVKTVLTGTVDLVSRRDDATVVSITDASAALSSLRPFETYNTMLAAQVIGRLAQAAGVTTGPIVSTLQTAAYIANGRRTAAEQIATLADLGGGIASIDAEGRLTVMPWPVGIPTAAMRRDREFVALRTTTRRPAHDFVHVGAGGSGVAASPDAWLMNTDPVTNADAPDGTRSWRSTPVLRTAIDVDLADRGFATRRAAATGGLHGQCWLQPARRPGDVVQIQATEHDDETGPWLITGVRHSLAWNRAETVLTGVSAGYTNDLPGLAVGAIGGLP